jgi:hypothetical protein
VRLREKKVGLVRAKPASYMQQKYFNKLMHGNGKECSLPFPFKVVTSEDYLSHPVSALRQTY